MQMSIWKAEMPTGMGTNIFFLSNFKIKKYILFFGNISAH